MANAVNFCQPTSTSKSLILHQLLHGYAEGHRLLESSVDLPEDLIRLVLRLSDLSGSNVSSGFEDYITGYPLTSLQAYALAKTWYAPEMPRPGCVWTHTIVIPAAAMQRLVSLDCLLSLFRRPEKSGVRGSYDKPLTLDTVTESSAILTPQRDVLEKIMSLHYRQENTPVILGARNSKEFESSILSLWSQKWPSLRLQLTFCTGALAVRTFDKRPFDIQCVPTSKAREVMLDSKTMAGVSEAVIANSMPGNAPAWAIEAAEDASQISGGALRTFLWQVTNGSSERQDFEGLVFIYEALQRSIPLPELISTVAKNFPDVHSGEGLKSALFGEQRNIGLANYEERDLLLGIGTTSDYKSFDAEILALRKRAEELWVSQSEDATWLVGELFRSTLNPLGEETLAALIAGMEPEAARRITSRQIQFLPALFQAKPSLATSFQLWLAGGDRKRELFEAVAGRKDLDPTLIAGIVRALLESNSDNFIRRALDLWGTEAVFATLDWSEIHNGAMSDTCRESLRSHLLSVMEWVEGGPERSFPVLIAIARVVAPFSSKISQRDASVWLRTSRHLRTHGTDSDRTYVSAFLLALALNNAPPAPLELVAESFEYVHQAAWDQRLSDSAWIVVEPFVPELSWISNWDKCERLKRGLISAFLRNSWPASELQNRIKNNDLMEQLLRSARKVDGGERLLRAF
ncbi:MAG: hypothetical protein JWQ87_5557 [Candidatus Sulfotelmatobacter sp.]|nr:hypothetical protein [Candidatus Sulfotelmatobacter sp.]